MIIEDTINTPVNPNITPLFIIRGFRDSKLNISIVLIRLFEFINQYDGKTWAIFKTAVGKNSAGTNEPHKKLLPKAITFTIPFIASLLFIMFPIKKAMAKEHILNIKEFIIYRSPCKLNIMFPTVMKLIMTYNNHKIKAKILLDISKYMLYFLSSILLMIVLFLICSFWKLDRIKHIT